MDDLWLLPALYLGMSIGLLAAWYADERGARAPTWSDVLVMLTVGPLIALWICGHRALRTRRG